MEEKIIVIVRGKRASGRTIILNKISKFLQSEGFEIKREMRAFYNVEIQESDIEHSIIVINKFES